MDKSQQNQIFLYEKIQERRELNRGPRGEKQEYYSQLYAPIYNIFFEENQYCSISVRDLFKEALLKDFDHRFL